jgi:hypothetical protein
MGAQLGDDDVKRYLFGNQFGPMFLAVRASLEEALSEWDERHGTRADDIADEQELERAMNDGEVRVNDGGTMVYVDPYEWFREYETGADLRAELADLSDTARRSIGREMYVGTYWR